jgi:hypothetical protein
MGPDGETWSFVFVPWTVGDLFVSSELNAFFCQHVFDCMMPVKPANDVEGTGRIDFAFVLGFALSV